MAFRIDAAELRAFAKAARSADSTVARQLRGGVRAAGELVAADARKRADWSTLIPGSITVTAAGPIARVYAGGDAAPHAAALNNAGRAGSFRHPTNAWARKDRGEWKWADQTARPFLEPALEANAETAADLIVASVERGFLEALP